MKDSRQYSITIRFYQELNDFLQPKYRQLDYNHIINKGQTSKDLIESLGVPHTEVDLIRANGQSIDFGYQLQHGDRISVYPICGRLDITKVSKLHPKPLSEIKFILDVHLSKLACYLRLLGYDTLHNNNYGDAEIAEISVQDNRIVLTRDIGLLKRSVINYGKFVRNIEPRKQLKEIAGWLDLSLSSAPFSRCIRCNGLLHKVSKRKIEEQIEPDTRMYYQEFWQCDLCRQIYWQGSHYRKMKKIVADISG